MKILVCITHVPDTTSRIAFKNDDTEFDKNGVQYIIGPYDDYALARAVELKDSQDAEVTVLNVGTAESEPSIRKALAIGADRAIRINADPTDSYFVALQIAAVAKEEYFDLIMMGRESIDFNSGLVHSMVGELLGIPSFSPVMTLKLEGGNAKLSREIEGGKEFIEVGLPFVAGCQEPIAEWKIPNMRGIMSARSKPLDIKEPADGEALTALQKYSMPPAKEGCKMIEADQLDELVNLLKNEAKVIG